MKDKSNALLYIIGAIAVASLLASLSGAFQPNSLAPASTLDRSFGRILDTGIIRVAYISYPPSFSKDPNTKEYSGIFHEVLMEAAKKLDLKVEYIEETAWGTMIESVKSGRVDVVCTGIWPNATRGKFADFTSPIYFSPINAYVQIDNDTFDGNLSVADSGTVTIATIDGEMSSIIAQADYKSANVKALPQTTDVSQLLLEVSTGKADMTFVEPAVALRFQDKNPGMIKEVSDVSPVRIFSNVMMIAKGEAKLKSMLDITFDELSNSGFVDKVIEKYEGERSVFHRRAVPFQKIK